MLSEMRSGLNPCPSDKYLDPHVMLCTPCSALCSKVYDTPQDCRQYCPRFYEKITTTGADIAQPTNGQDAGDTDPNPAFMVVVICLLLVLFLLILLVFLGLFRVRRRTNRAPPSCSACNCQKIYINIIKNDIEAEAKSNDDASQKKVICCDSSTCHRTHLLCCSKRNGMRHSEEDVGKDLRIHVMNDTQEKNSLDSDSSSNPSVTDQPMRSSDFIADSGKGSSVSSSVGSPPDVAEDNRSCPPSDALLRSGPIGPENAQTNLDLYSNRIPFKGVHYLNNSESVQMQMHSDTNDRRQRKRSLYEKRAPSLPKKPPRSATGSMSSLSFHLMSNTERSLGATCGHFVSHSVPQSHTSYDKRWKNIMRLYELVEGLLSIFTWIAGCMISTDALEVVIQTCTEVPSVDRAYTKLQEKIPPDLHSYLEITEEGPSLELCCSRYGAGCTLREMSNNDHPRAATTTLVGYAEGAHLVSFAFSVGHVLQKGRACEVDCTCYGDCRSTVGACVSLVDTVTGRGLSNIQHKIYDMSLIKMNQPISQSNRTILKGDQQDRGDVVIEKVIDEHILSRKIRIVLGSSRTTFKAKVTKVWKVKHHLGFLTNVLEIVSGDPSRTLDIQPGHSGSLVTLCPDANNVARAFAYVVGFKPGHREIAIALPLWENISKVCESEEGYRHTLKDIHFKDFDFVESGYASKFQSDCLLTLDVHNC